MLELLKNPPGVQSQSSEITPEALTLLLREFPSEELQIKMEKLEAEYPDLEWGIPEQYLLSLCVIPNCKVLLEAWLFALTHEQSVTTLTAHLEAVRTVCEEMVRCKELHELMKAMLIVSNRLNAHTHRGNQAGLVFESLTLFDEHKAVTGAATDTALSFAIALWKKSAAALGSESRTIVEGVGSADLSSFRLPILGGLVGARVAALKQNFPQSSVTAKVALPASAVQTTFSQSAVLQTTIPPAPVLSANLKKLVQILSHVDRGLPPLSELEAEVHKLVETKEKLGEDRWMKMLSDHGTEGWQIAEEVEKGDKRVEQLLDKLETTKKAWTNLVQMFGWSAAKSSKEFLDHAHKLAKQIDKYL